MLPGANHVASELCALLASALEDRERNVLQEKKQQATPLFDFYLAALTRRHSTPKTATPSVANNTSKGSQTANNVTARHSPYYF